MKSVELAFAEAGRTGFDDYHSAALTYSCVLQPGETLESDRVIDQVGSMVASSLHYWWELYRQRGSDSFIRDEVRDVWDQYLGYVEDMETPPDKRYQQIHQGHCTYLVPEERQFITPAMIRFSGGFVGGPDEIIEMLRDREAGGLGEVTLMPPMDQARECFADFAEHVIARY